MLDIRHNKKKQWYPFFKAYDRSFISLRYGWHINFYTITL